MKNTGAFIGLLVAVATVGSGFWIGRSVETLQLVVNKTGVEVVGGEYRDLGPVPAELGAKVICFQLINHDSAPALLAPGFRSCGCVSVAFPQKLEPHETGVAEVRLDPRGKVGSIRVLGGIVVNNSLALDLQVTAEVIPALTAEPSALSFSEVGGADAPAQVIRLSVRRAASDPPTPPLLEACPDGIRCELVEATSADESVPFRRSTFIYSISTTNRDVRKSPLSNAMLVWRASECRVYVPVSVVVSHHPVLKGPTSVILTRHEPRQILRLWSSSTAEWQVTAIRSEADYVELRQKTNGKSRIHEFEIVARSSDVWDSVGREVDAEIETNVDDGQPYRLRILLY